MQLCDMIKPDAVIPNLKATSKKQALQELARKAAEITGAEERAVFDVLLERERLGTTGVGNGIAIPHGKLPGLERIHVIFALSEEPFMFDSFYDLAVDLLFLLLAPEDAGADHLKALAKISRLLREGQFCDKLRGSEKADALYGLLMDATTPKAA